ncbi:MAG: hypothetical protein PHV30_10670 [Candidatus Margulisbacteria bacterium]|nr:hypothetical protein [Candidatus Margulisiibacteriota bacterium]
MKNLPVVKKNMSKVRKAIYLKEYTVDEVFEFFIAAIEALEDEVINLKKVLEWKISVN